MGWVNLPQAIAQLPSNVRIITDENVAGYYEAAFAKHPVIKVPAGETSKSLEVFGRVLGNLAESGANRKTTVVAIGGGVVGDLAGFVSATYMRGINLVQIPTTLLAMVDSSVGGKVGIDLPQGKNLAGAFMPPLAVFIPMEVLSTLPKRQYLSGMAEVVKTGFIIDAQMVDTLANETISVDSALLAELVRRCVKHKALVVEQDEFETTGLRAILNFGHTIAHAIEQVTGYGPVLHGEAVAVGMRMEALLAERLGVANSGLEKLVVKVLERQGLPTTVGMHLDADLLLSAMRKDKKRESTGLPFSLVSKPGQCKLYKNVSEAEVRALLNDL